MAELERKIDALTATLHAQKAGGAEIRHHGGFPQHEGPPSISSLPPEGTYRLGTLEHDWSNTASTRYPDIPPGYGPAQSIQRGPDLKRRRLDDTHAVSTFVRSSSAPS